MAPDLKVIAPRLHTPSGASESRRTTNLPDELVVEQLERLALFAAITGGLWTLGLFVDIVLVPLTWGHPVSRPAVAVEACGVLSAAGMYCWRAIARGRGRPRRTSASGTWCSTASASRF